MRPNHDICLANISTLEYELGMELTNPRYQPDVLVTYAKSVLPPTPAPTWFFTELAATRGAQPTKEAA